MDYVSSHEETDCSSTVIQLQSNDFHGHTNWSNEGQFHDVDLLLHHIDFWQLDEITPETVRGLFGNIKVGWMVGHHHSLTKCMAMIESERPPSTPMVAAVDGGRCKPGYVPGAGKAGYGEYDD